MDDDLQNPPEEIPRLLAALTPSHEVVYGVSYEPHHGKFREIASRLAKLIMKKALGAEIPFGASSFRAFQTCLREAFSEYKDPFVSIDVLLTWGSKDLTYVVVRQDPRLVGKSNYTIPRLLVHALNMITGFSSLPLRIASLFGFVSVLFGVAVLAYVLGRFFIEGGSVPGFPFLASLVAIFSGVQLFSLGIMGEYIARIHFRTMDRPQYAVREEYLSK
jgi:undecaprenyl-phosphate 4-deoxy-4-formamido-L-arabinose transferase